MSKKMMKRSLALSALMAFVITGQALAASVLNDNYTGSGEIVASSDVTYAYRVSDGNEYKVTVDNGKILTIKNIRGTENKGTYGVQVFGGGKLTLNGNIVLDVLSNSNTVQYFTNAINTGSGKDGQYVKFLGDSLVVNSKNTGTNQGYTAQGASGDGDVYFNSKNTSINVQSHFGVNGVAMSAGKAYFNGEKVDINLLIDNNNDGVGDVGLVGTSNAIGLMGDVEVVGDVQEFNVTVKGSGVDSKNPASSNGTAAVYATINDNILLNAQKFVANVVAGVDKERSDNTYGVRANAGGVVTINSSIIDIDVTDAKGSAYAVRAGCNDLLNVDEYGRPLDKDGNVTTDSNKYTYLKKSGTIVLGGDDSVITIDATAENGYAVGIAAHRSNDKNKENASAVTVNGKSLVITATGDSAYGVLGMNNTTGEAKNVSTVTIDATDTTINAKNGLVALSQSKIDVNGNLTVNSKDGSAIIARGNSTVEVNKGTTNDVKLYGDIEFSYDKPTSGSLIDADIDVTLNTADSVFEGRIYKGGTNIPADKDDVTGMKISLSNGAQWNLTGNSIVNQATFGEGSVLNLVDGTKFTGENAVYALSGADGANDTLTVKKGALLQIGGMKEVTYNVADNFDKYDINGWNAIADNALMKVSFNDFATEGVLQATLKADAGAMEESGAAPVGSGEMLQDLIQNGGNEATAEFIQSVTSNGGNAAAANNALANAFQLAEAGGNSCTAASVANNVSGVTTGRMGFNGGKHGGHKGGHGVGLLAEDSGAAIWAQYVHGKDDVKDMPMSGGVASYEGQFNGIVMGVDFKKVGKFQSGVAFNYGEGDTNSVGNAVRTSSDYDFWGVGYYGNIRNEDTNFIFDVNYAKSDSEVEQINNGTTLEANPETTTWSAGVKVEKLYQNENVQIVPYTGLRFMSIDTDSYKATNGNDTLFNYAPERQDIWLLPLGVSIKQEVVNDNGWVVTPKVDLSYIWAFGDTDSEMTVAIPGVSATSRLGYTVMDEESWLGVVGLEAAKGDWTFGVSYSYQKGDHSENEKWYVDAKYNF